MRGPTAGTALFALTLLTAHSCDVGRRVHRLPWSAGTADGARSVGLATALELDPLLAAYEGSPPTGQEAAAGPGHGPVAVSGSIWSLGGCDGFGPALDAHVCVRFTDRPLHTLTLTHTHTRHTRTQGPHQHARGLWSLHVVWDELGRFFARFDPLGHKKPHREPCDDDDQDKDTHETHAHAVEAGHGHAEHDHAHAEAAHGSAGGSGSTDHALEASKPMPADTTTTDEHAHTGAAHRSAGGSSSSSSRDHAPEASKPTPADTTTTDEYQHDHAHAGAAPASQASGSTEHAVEAKTTIEATAVAGTNNGTTPAVDAALLRGGRHRGRRLAEPAAEADPTSIEAGTTMVGACT